VISTRLLNVLGKYCLTVTPSIDLFIVHTIIVTVCYSWYCSPHIWLLSIVILYCYFHYIVLVFYITWPWLFNWIK